MTSLSYFVAELEVGPVPTAGLSGVSNVIDQSVSDIVLSDTSLDPSLELVNAVTDSLTDPLNTGPIDALISGSAAPATRGSAPMALAMTLPAPGPAPAPPIKTNGLDLANQLATIFINTKRDSSKAQGLDKVLQVLSNANQTSVVNDVNSLSSLLMALRGEGAVDNKVGRGLDKTAVMSAITGNAAAPLDRLDLLVKDLGLSALFPGGKVDRLFAAGGGIPSSDGLASGSADASRLATLQTLLNKGIDGNSFSDNRELALLAATIGGIGGQGDPLGGNIMPSNTESKINSALDIPVTGGKGSTNNLKNVLKKGLLMTPGSLGNDSVADTVQTGATTKECLSKGLEIWCDPVTPWGPTPGVTKWCLLNCRDKNNCDRNRCACTCVGEKIFRQKFEKLPIKSP